MSLPSPQQPLRRQSVEIALVVVLAFPWLVHGLVVWLSAAGLRPLGSRGFSIGILVFATGVVALVAGRLARRPTDSIPEPASPLSPVGRVFASLISAGSCAALCGSMFAAFALPVIAYDALAYRLPVIADWLDAGGVAWLATDDAVRNGYPLGQEAVSAVVAAATGSMRLVAGTSFFYVVAGALSIWCFARRVGVRDVLARGAGALFLLVPMVILNAPTAYVDASFAGAAVAFLLLSALLIGSGRQDFVLAVAVGMAAAHTLALKGTGVAVVLSAVLAAAVAWVARRGRVDGAAGAAGLAVAVLFAAPGAFWLLRNVLHTGNPLWPVEVRAAGHTLLPGVASMESVLDVAHNTPPELARLSEPLRVLRTWAEWNGPALDFDDRAGGLGLIWPIFAVPAIVFTVVRLARKDATLVHRASIAVALGATLFAFAIQPMRWWPRYTIWLWGIGAVAMALSAEWLLQKDRKRLLTAAFAAVTLAAFAEGGVALFHANGLATAVRADAGGISSDARRAANATAWVDDAFWNLEVARARHVCRGAWKPGTDDANLDGVLAQLSPRPSMHVVADDDGDWAAVQRASKDAGCTELLLLRGSPVLPLAQSDPGVTVEAVVAFDPLYVVRARPLARLDARNVTQ